ncbi:MAG: radical SAM protein [Gammaproteobacteria bacterium]
MTNLKERIAYKTHYFDDIEEFIGEVLNKTVVPYQLEVQPGRIKGKSLCWMSCPYCYGGSSKNTDVRIEPDRYRELIRQTANGPHGSIDKIIFAGYATDPLNYEFIDDLIHESINNNQIFGIHTKLLKVSDRLIELITSSTNRDTSYLTISVDSGSPESYNKTHGITSNADVYNRILNNIQNVCESRKQQNGTLDISANYLITDQNNENEIIEKGIQDLIRVGVDSIRLSFAQVPRGTERADETGIPDQNNITSIYNRIKPIVEKYNSEKTEVLLLNYDNDKNFTERRTLPCFARFIYPAISYEGYLSNCSQSAAPHFKNMSLGNLTKVDFWDAFYNYDVNNFEQMLDSQHMKMITNDCRCDRKEHTVNTTFKNYYESISLEQDLVCEA